MSQCLWGQWLFGACKNLFGGIQQSSREFFIISRIHLSLTVVSLWVANLWSSMVSREASAMKANASSIFFSLSFMPLGQSLSGPVSFEAHEKMILLNIEDAKANLMAITAASNSSSVPARPSCQRSPWATCLNLLAGWSWNTGWRRGHPPQGA